MENEVNILSEEKPKTVKLADGKEYIIPPFDITTLANVEKTMGIGGKKLAKKIEEEPIQTYQLILWALLKQNHSELTLEQAGKLINLKTIKDFSEYLTAIIALTS